MTSSLPMWQAKCTPAEAIKIGKRAKLLRIKLAREDVNVFNEYVLRNEADNLPIEQQPFHQEFQRIADKNRRYIIWSAVEMGKTQQITIGRTLWELGRQPNLRFALICANDSKSRQLVGAVSRYIESSEQLHEVFPELLPGPKWSGGAITIKRDGYAKDPSIQSSPVTGKLYGSRLDRVIFDDFLTPANAYSEDFRVDLWSFWEQTVRSRLTQQARVGVLGNAFHPKDFMHQLQKQAQWKSFYFPVIKAGKLLWPERWPITRIEEWREELHPDEFARVLMCRARDDASGRFKKDWIQGCLDRGAGKQLTSGIAFVPAGFRVLTGVDLGTRQHKKSGLTVFFTIIIHPNEDREILNIESGRWHGMDIVKRVIATHQAYHSIVWVEGNAAQQFIVDFAQHLSAVPVKSFNTGSNKWNVDFGIESLAAEMHNKKWIIPSKHGQPAHPEIRAWMDEMLFYDPRDHTGDRLMASWIAREASRVKTRKATVRRLDTFTR